MRKYKQKILEFSADRMQQPLHVLILGMWQIYCHSYFALISLCHMAIGLWTFSWMEPMCTAELTWYTLKVYNWSLMKHTWWNWHAVPGTAYWNMRHTAGTLRKIKIYFILRNNWHIDVPWNILKIFYSIYFLFCSTHGFDIELYDILDSIVCKLYILRIGVLDWHIHSARVWCEIIKIVEHCLDFHLGSCEHFDEIETVSGIFFLTDTGIQDFVLKFWNMHYFSF